MSSQPEGEGLIQATFRLAMHSKSCPDLKRAEAQARLRLASAIIALDDAHLSDERHTFMEQAAVENALGEYGNALASLLRKEHSERETDDYREVRQS
ncbi:MULTISPECIES: hypothetical protein [Nocardiaceae]|uniref:hypothetical protein n=1 Tax=Nocardiaceae TaxID=85025 RepID=UPI00050C9707|nr:hypothetical protein [Rhodococcus fascians]